MVEALTHKTPIGILTLESDGKSLTRILFPQQKIKPNGDVQRLKDCPDNHPVFVAACRQLDEYFAGKRQTFDLPLDPAGTDFQKQVWRKLIKIPYGSTTSYGELAKALGKPTASRAVGAANGRNPLPIVVPCHRVIGSTGKLTGFAGGLKVKKELLTLEGALHAE